MQEMIVNRIYRVECVTTNAIFFLEYKGSRRVSHRSACQYHYGPYFDRTFAHIHVNGAFEAEDHYIFEIMPDAFKLNDFL